MLKGILNSSPRLIHTKMFYSDGNELRVVDCIIMISALHFIRQNPTVNFPVLVWINVLSRMNNLCIDSLY